MEIKSPFNGGVIGMSIYPFQYWTISVGEMRTIRSGVGRVMGMRMIKHKNMVSHETKDEVNNVLMM